MYAKQDLLTLAFPFFVLLLLRMQIGGSIPDIETGGMSGPGLCTLPRGVEEAEGMITVWTGLAGPVLRSARLGNRALQWWQESGQGVASNYLHLTTTSKPSRTNRPPGDPRYRNCLQLDFDLLSTAATAAPACIAFSLAASATVTLW
ncbi:hypothetical protein DFH08DRAFT_809974 [Mycena albidolilacea]|uniref:Uncharacterized protein n=1 Tax=Mycena albidolilacea TaxID=1033008 RepID=A0AAD7EQB2_9AGAR|nr:hypothetical protein DFH08DRAFT_809974 [Mycena albidolilacea]